MSPSLDKLIDKLEQPNHFQDLIKDIKNIAKECDINDSTKDDLGISVNSEDLSPEEQKHIQILNYILIQVLCKKPELLDESQRDLVTNHLKLSNIKARSLVNINSLLTLSKSAHQLQTWVKFEFLLVNLIKGQVYDSKTLANEVLTTVKHELPPEIASKFSSVISSCVKQCRSIKSGCTEEEEEEKWCEIIDWMSWFIGGGESEH